MQKTCGNNGIPHQTTDPTTPNMGNTNGSNPAGQPDHTVGHIAQNVYFYVKRQNPVNHRTPLSNTASGMPPM